MKKLVLRKGKKIINDYATAYDVANDDDTLKKCFPAERVPGIKDFLRRNAFAFCIKGGKARLGDGYILEMKEGFTP